MELCLSPTSPGMSVSELATLGTWAEEKGYRSAWMSEVAGPDAFVLGTALAGVTTQMDVGVAAVAAYTRTPAVLTMAAISVSEALEGRRFRLGIGSSSEAIVAGWNGVPFERPLTRVRETVEAVRAGLNGQGDYRGATVAMHRFRPAGRPAGPIELYVAALGTRMLAVSGAVADGVCLNLMPPRVVPRQLQAVAEGAAKADRKLPDDFEVMARLQVAITDDPGPLRQMLREVMLGGYLAQKVYNDFIAWQGYEEEAAAIRQAWAARDREGVYRAIHDRLIDDLSIIGPVAHVKARLDEFAEAGVTQAAISVPSSDPHLITGTLQALAPAV